jgi:hypothetical protein
MRGGVGIGTKLLHDFKSAWVRESSKQGDTLVSYEQGHRRCHGKGPRYLRVKYPQEAQIWGDHHLCRCGGVAETAWLPAGRLIKTMMCCRGSTSMV